MNKQELNEFLAEKMFGMRYDKYSKYWTEEMPAYFRSGTAWVPIELPDYTLNYQPVLEKIAESIMIKICPSITGVYNVELSAAPANPKKIGTIYGFGDTIGEAICRAAVEFLKAQEVRDE